MGARAFKSHHGTYLTAEEGTLHAHHELTHKAHFHVEKHHGDKVSLRTHHGKYVAADHHHIRLVDHHNEDTHWHLEHHGGKVAIRSRHGHYLGVDSHHQVHLHKERGHDELFEEKIV